MEFQEEVEFCDGCNHEEIETEEAVVCMKCGLVLGSLLAPEANVAERVMLSSKPYTDVQRLESVDKSLGAFIEKVGVCKPLYPSLFETRQRLYAMKKGSEYRALNYAIALSCIYYEDEEMVQILSLHLPRSKDALMRNASLFKTSPVFFKMWMKVITPKKLRKAHFERFIERTVDMTEQEEQLMIELIQHYGVEPKLPLAASLAYDDYPDALIYILSTIVQAF